jgi:hypothetical protein
MAGEAGRGRLADLEKYACAHTNLGKGAEKFLFHSKYFLKKRL